MQLLLGKAAELLSYLKLYLRTFGSFCMPDKINNKAKINVKVKSSKIISQYAHFRLRTFALIFCLWWKLFLIMKLMSKLWFLCVSASNKNLAFLMQYIFTLKPFGYHKNFWIDDGNAPNLVIFGVVHKRESIFYYVIFDDMVIIVFCQTCLPGLWKF